MSYKIELTKEQLRDLLFVVDHVLFMEEDRFKQWCAEGKDTEHHLYPKALRSLALLENIA